MLDVFGNKRSPPSYLACSSAIFFSPLCIGNVVLLLKPPCREPGFRILIPIRIYKISGCISQNCEILLCLTAFFAKLYEIHI